MVVVVVDLEMGMGRGARAGLGKDEVGEGRVVGGKKWERK